MNFINKTIFFLVVVSLAGCLKTRDELNGGSMGANSPDSQDRYVSGQFSQQQKAQIDSRFFEIDRDFRQLYGKIESLEGQMGQMDLVKKASEDSPESSEKIKVLESRISTLEEALLSLDKKISGAKTSSRSKISPPLEDLPKQDFQQGEYFFAKKDYINSIQAFDRYRKRFPKGQYYAIATYNMGEAFRRLNLPKEASPFFKEVIERDPSTKVARRATAQLQKIQ